MHGVRIGDIAAPDRGVGATMPTMPATPATPTRREIPAAVVPGTEDALVARLRAGEPEACEEMIDRHGARLLRTLLRLRGDRFEAEDVLQETWIRACRSAREFRGESSLRTWLDRIAANAAAMAERRQRALSRGGGRGELPLGAAAEADDEPGIEPAATGDTESAVVWAETLAELAHAVAALPPSLRAVLVLRDIEGASTSEAATDLGISEDAVKQRLHRARERLREALRHIAGEASRLP